MKIQTSTNATSFSSHNDGESRTTSILLEETDDKKNIIISADDMYRSFSLSYEQAADFLEAFSMLFNRMDSGTEKTGTDSDDKGI